MHNFGDMGEQKMSYKASDIIISLTFLSFFMITFGLFMQSMSDRYGVEYDNETLDAYNQLDAMGSLAEEIEVGSEIEEKTGVLDVIGSYFTDAYNVLKLTKASFNTLDTMTNTAIAQANLGVIGEYLRKAISTAILIVVVLGIIISAIMKWYL